MSKQDGGPAFPHEAYGMGRAYDGMTLRDYFAAKAMQASMISDSGNLYSSDEERELLAMDSYAIADAMLKQREGEGT